MNNSVYKNHKGINQSIEFKGLKAQYIWYLAAGIILLLMLFSGLYLIRVPLFICVSIILILGALLVIKTYQMSRKYGEFGLMKRIAKKFIPRVIKSKNRNVFLEKSSTKIKSK